MPSGFPALDAQLPAGGWPVRMLTELLLPHPGIGEMRLLAPCLAAMLREDHPVMLFDPPAGLTGAALAALGIEPARLLVVYTRRPTISPGPQAAAGLPSGAAPLRGADSHVEPGGDPLWALEQALRSGHVGMLLAWLPPGLSPERLRRLQFAAQPHPGPAFMLREQAARWRPSVAPLRLGLSGAGIDRLAVHLIKRRGPPLARPLLLDLQPVLPACVAAVAARDLPSAAGARPGGGPALALRAAGSGCRTAAGGAGAMRVP